MDTERYDDLFELVVESVLNPPPEEYFLAEEKFGDGKQKKVTNAYNAAKTSVGNYWDAKSEYMHAKKNGDSQKASDAKSRVDSAKSSALNDIKKYKAAKSNAGKGGIFDNAKRFVSDKKEWGAEKLLGGKPYADAKDAAAKHKSENSGVFSKQKELDKEARDKSGVINKAKDWVGKKKQFATGFAAGGATGALCTGISKVLGVSLLSIAAIKAAGGVKAAGKGAMLSGKAKHDLASAQAKELKANAKLSKAEKKKIESEIKRQKELDKKSDVYAKIYEAESKRLEKEAKDIETAMQKCIEALNAGEIKESEARGVLSDLMKKAKDLQERVKKTQAKAEKSIKESAEFDAYEYDVQFVNNMMEYAVTDFLESVDLNDAIDFVITESVLFE